MDFFVATLYRFFYRVRAHCLHGLLPDGPKAFPPPLAPNSLHLGLPARGAQPSGRHARSDGVWISECVLLPLCDVACAWGVLQDVRDAEVCVTLVGDLLREAPSEGPRG